MADSALLDAMWANTTLVRALGRSGAGARLIEREGVLASVVPVCPERSVINSAYYTEPAALVAGYEELEQAYMSDGLEAWTVWVPGTDHASADFLGSRGHVLDAAPVAMAARLDDIDLSAAEGSPAELSCEPDPALLGRLNDRAYGYEGSFERALGGLSPDIAYWYTALLEGEPVSGLFVLDHEGDAEIEFVATVPEARGRGLAGFLMARAIADARERGCETTTLAATKMGRPVYERLGYRPLGVVEMWEKRLPAGG